MSASLDTLDEGTSKHTPYISSQAEVASWVQRVKSVQVWAGCWWLAEAVKANVFMSVLLEVLTSIRFTSLWPSHPTIRGKAPPIKLEVKPLKYVGFGLS